MQQFEQNSASPSAETSPPARPLRPIDSPFFTRLLNDPDVMREFASAVLGEPVTVLEAHAPLLRVYRVDDPRGADVVALVKPADTPEDDAIRAHRPLRPLSLRGETLLAFRIQTEVSPEGEPSDWTPDIVQRWFRFIESFMIANYMPDDYPDTTVVLLTDYDILQTGQFVAPFYRVFVNGNGGPDSETYDSGNRQLCINAAGKENPSDPYEAQLRKLMNLLLTGDADPADSSFPALRARLEHLRTNCSTELAAALIIDAAVREARQSAREEAISVFCTLLEEIQCGRQTFRGARDFLKNW